LTARTHLAPESSAKNLLVLSDREFGVGQVEGFGDGAIGDFALVDVDGADQ
jgi:hypothetical protein